MIDLDPQHRQLTNHLLRYWDQRQVLEVKQALDPAHIAAAQLDLIEHVERDTWRTLVDRARGRMLVACRSQWYLDDPSQPIERDQLVTTAQAILNEPGAPFRVLIMLWIRALVLPPVDLFAN